MTRQDVAIFELDKEQKGHLDDLLKVCHTHLEHVDDAMIRDAFALACQSHKGVTRASGEPYYLHPLEVAKIVASELSIDGESVVAALIHDTVEDTDVTLVDVRDVFGETVANLIDGVTKIEGVFKNRQSKQAETFMKLILSMADDIRVVLIKFADRLHNIRTLQRFQHRKKSDTLPSI